MADPFLMRGRVVGVGGAGVRVELPGRSAVTATAPLQHLGQRPAVGDPVLVARVGSYQDDLVVVGILSPTPGLLVLPDQTGPPDIPDAGGLLYVLDGHLHYLNPAGVDTQLDIS